MNELAVNTAEEEDVQERLAVEALLGTIPGPFARSICSRRIDSLQKALEEARLMHVLDEEEEGKGKVQALTEEPRMEGREETQPPRREGRQERRNRRRPVCWACGAEGHVLLNCELWQSFRQDRDRGCPSRTNER